MAVSKKYIPDLLVMTKDTDPDLRFMALNDLEKEMLNPSVNVSRSELLTYSQILLRCLDDEFSEVRTQSLKCFESVPCRLRLDILPLVKELVGKKPKKISITSTIYTMAIHNILKNLPPIEQIYIDIINILLPEVLKNKDVFYVEIDYIEVLSDIADYLGKFMTSDQILKTLLFLIDSSFNADTIISKKSITACNLLLKNVKDKNTITQFIDCAIKTYKSCKNAHEGNLKLLPLISALITGNPQLSQAYIAQIWDLPVQCLDMATLKTVNDDYESQQNKDTVRVEALMVLVKLFTFCGGDEVESLVPDAFLLCQSLMCYDPYDDNSETQDDSDADDYSNDESDDDNYSDYDQGDEYEEEDSCSWKIRVEALSLLMEIIEHFPMKMPLIFKYNFSILLNQTLIEKNKSVLCKLIECLSLIFGSCTSDGIYYGLLDSKTMAETTSGRRYSDVSMQCEDDPYFFLSDNSTTICETISKFLANSETVVYERPNLIVSFLANLTKSLRGLESKYVEVYIVSLNESWNNTIGNTDAFSFYSALLENESIENFGDGLKYLFMYLQQCLNNDTNHKLVIQGLNLMTTFFEKQIDQQNDKPISEHTVATFTTTFTQLLIDRVLNRNLSIEIRLQSLNVLVLMCCKVELDPETTQKILNVFIDTLSTEVLAFNSLNSIIKIIQSNLALPQITSTWIDAILKVALEYFNISELSTNSIQLVSDLAKLKFLNEENYRSALTAIENLHLENMFSSLNCKNVGIILTQALTCVNVANDLNKLINILMTLSSFDEFDEILPKIIENLLMQTSNDELLEAIQHFGKITDVKVSKLLAVLTVATQNYSSIENVLNNLKSGDDVYYSLVFLNQVSKSIDLNVGLEPFLMCYSSDKTNVLHMAIKIIATIVSSYCDKYINEFLNYLKQTVYLKPAFKTLASILQNTTISCDLAVEIFGLVIEVQRNSTSKVDGDAEYENAASCLGSLVVKYDLLESLLQVLGETTGQLPILRITIADTVKYTFNECQFLENTSLRLLVKYSEMTTNNFIFNENLTFKQVGISNLSLVLHRKPNIAISLLSKILPNIIETEIKPNKEYIRTQFIGPYKHKIDDGLNYRKQVFETIYGLLKSLEDNKHLMFLCDTQWALYFNRFFDSGVKDDQSIASVCLLTGLKIFEKDSGIFTQNVGELDVFDSFVTRCRKTLNKKIPDNAVKQDIEKQNNLVKMVIRFLQNTNLLVEKNRLILTGNQITNWGAFITETKSRFPIFNTSDQILV